MFFVEVAVFEIRYSDRPNDRRLSKDEALAELRELAQAGDIKSVEVRSEDGEIFIAVFPPSEKDYDDWITVESEVFVSQDASLNFLREAELLDYLRK
jgi:hypothetical protein